MLNNPVFINIIHTFNILLFNQYNDLLGNFDIRKML